MLCIFLCMCFHQYFDEKTSRLGIKRDSSNSEWMYGNKCLAPTYSVPLRRFERHITTFSTTLFDVLNVPFDVISVPKGCSRRPVWRRKIGSKLSREEKICLGSLPRETHHENVLETFYRRFLYFRIVSLCVWVFVCGVCVYVCACMCVCVCMYVCVWGWVCMCAHCAHECTCVYMCVHVCACVCMCVCVCVCHFQVTNILAYNAEH